MPCQLNNPYYIIFWRVRQVFWVILWGWFEKIRSKNIIDMYFIPSSPTTMNPALGQAAAQPTAIQSFLDSTIVSYGLKILWAIAVILLLLMISKFIANIVRKNIVKNADPSNKHIDKIWKLIHDITFYILVIFSFFIGFEMMGFNVGLIVWGISFWVGLAFKEILGNMIAGIMILYTKEFKLGDIIEVQADQAYFGRIEEITIRYTIIRTLDLRQVVLPNMTLITVPIKTFSAEPLVKLIGLFGVSYDSDTANVIEIVKTNINSFDFVKEKNTTKVFVSNFADSYIEIKAFFSFDPNCGLLPEFAIGDVNQRVAKAFDDNNINIPFNMLTVNFDKTSDAQNLMKNLPPQQPLTS